MNDYQILIEHYIELHKYINDNIFHLDDKVIKENFNWGSILKFGLIGIGIIGLIVVLLKTFTNNISRGSSGGSSSGSSSSNNSKSNNSNIQTELDVLMKKINNAMSNEEKNKENLKIDLSLGSSIILKTKELQNEEIINLINNSIKYNSIRTKIDNNINNFLNNNLFLNDNIIDLINNYLSKINLDINTLYNSAELIKNNLNEMYKYKLNELFYVTTFTLITPYLIYDNIEILNNINILDHIYKFDEFINTLKNIHDNINEQIKDKISSIEYFNKTENHLYYKGLTSMLDYSLYISGLMEDVLPNTIKLLEKDEVIVKENNKPTLNDKKFPYLKDFKSKYTEFIAQLIVVYTVNGEIIDLIKGIHYTYFKDYIHKEKDPINCKSDYEPYLK